MDVKTLLTAVKTFVWGPPTLIMLMGTGLFLTIVLKGLQVKKFPRAIKAIFTKEEGLEDDGDVSPFATLCTTMAADIGTGSIVGVATAIRIGGPGALFWMWMSAILGMATKYAENLLGVKYRTKDEKGEMCGGPMYYIEKGMGEKWIWLAKLFAIFGIMTALLGCGTFPQVNAITESLNYSFDIPVVIAGLVVTVMAAIVIIGGIKTISRVAEVIVPVMAGCFVIGSVVALIMNHEHVPAAFQIIRISAFNPKSVAGGVTGAGMVSFLTVVRSGVARGVYTNEAGLGSSPIVAAAAKTDSCARQGLISMTSVFFTTILTCTMTGLVIVTSGALSGTDFDGSPLVTHAYRTLLPGNLGMYIVVFGIIFFSFTTILGWSYYGERCMLYLTGNHKSVRIFKIFYIAALAVAPFLELSVIWIIADITNALMILPNLIALIYLAPVVKAETEAYFGVRKEKVAEKERDERETFARSKRQ